VNGARVTESATGDPGDPRDPVDPADPVDAADPAEHGRGRRARTRLAPFVVAIVALAALGLFVVLAGAGGADNDTADTPLLDRPAPGTVGRLADGATFDLSRRKGSWVVLNFFTSTCVPCQQEHPELVRFAQQQSGLGGEGAELYTVVVDDDDDAVEQFFDAEGGDWPLVYDDEGAIAVGFGVAKVPETWIIDPDGIVRGRVISQVTADFLGSQLQQLRELRAGTG
jgi:cytochrome c biogenesis protein CcmG/thiol:disulfide interchange protein DsbE